ncbi:MAG TPA: TIGR03643 family protein [Flavobacterium sp.]|nr:TIGR03643 family protein [Flavobacterium sp.]
MHKKVFTEVEIDRIIEMAWEDRTTFDAITFQFGISEQQTIEIMRRELKLSSFKLWRKRVQGRVSKHAKLRVNTFGRFKSRLQRQITQNKISKR